MNTLDGLIRFVYDPVPARLHDMNVYRQSVLDDCLHQNAVIDWKQYYISGDAKFERRPWIHIAYNRIVSMPQKSAFNKDMKSACQSVRWIYKYEKQ